MTLITIPGQVTEKLLAANTALQSFAPTSIIERHHNGYYVRWTDSRGEFLRRWQCRGQDFYPIWYRTWGHGGTASTALSQLIRWLRELPVLPMASWRYWASERVALVTAEACEALSRAAYPEQACCVLCGGVITGSMDWWNLDGVSGPCHMYTVGCRERGREP
jgi:hypothetical protein